MKDTKDLDRFGKFVFAWLTFMVGAGSLLVLALLTLGVIALGSWVLG